MDIVEKAEFKKVILSIIISIAVFFGFKTVLPDRLLPDSTASQAGMLIDSVMLEALDGNVLVEIFVADTLVTDSIYAESLKADYHITDTLKNDTMSVLLAEQSRPITKDGLKGLIKPFKRANFIQKLEKRKPYLFFPNGESPIVVEKPIIDTLLDPSISIQGYGYLQRFYSKLANLENGKEGRVRVAYFGDSMNDGDLIVQDVRSMLQEHYGGNGVGFVSVTSLSAASRGSVYHKHSDNWLTQSFVSVRRPTKSFGVDGQVFLAPYNSSWVSYTAGSVTHSSALYNPTLLYGQSENAGGYVNVKLNNGDINKVELTPKYAVNTKSLGASYAKSINLNFNNVQDIPIYGMDFSSNSGVHVDNFSLRGNSGLTLAGFNTNLMNAFDKVLNYDLIILHYGTNVLNYGSLDYTFYENNMTVVINKLRYCFPNADILVISTADKASKINMKMATDPAVIALTKAQKRFARDTGVGYIDLYNLMGGYGSMVDWVNKQLANKDYTHFNVKGSKEIGTLLYTEMTRGFQKYKMQLEKDISRAERENQEKH